jgi:hypothetical protein
MAKPGKDFEITPWPAAKIKQCERSFTSDVLKHCRCVLCNIMLARAFPERFGALVVMVQGAVCDVFQISLIQILLDSSL